MAEYKNYYNLIEDCENHLKTPDGSKRDLIKSVINMVYLNEILTVDDLYPLYWLQDFDDTLASKDESTISAITLADPGVITTSAAHGLVADDIISIYDIVGTTTLNNRVYKVNTAPSTTTLTLIDLDGTDAIDTSAMTAWSSGGTIHHRGLTLATTGKDVQRILKAQWHDQYHMKPITMEELEENTSWWGSGTSIPERYYHRKTYTAAGVETNQLLWFHAASGEYDLRYWFEKRPTKLDDDADVPLLPPQFHHAIVTGTLARLAEYNVQTENAPIWPALYQAQLEQIKKHNRKKLGDNKHFFKP